MRPRSSTKPRCSEKLCAHPNLKPCRLAELTRRIHIKEGSLWSAPWLQGAWPRAAERNTGRAWLDISGRNVVGLAPVLANAHAGGRGSETTGTVKAKGKRLAVGGGCGHASVGSAAKEDDAKTEIETSCRVFTHLQHTCQGGSSQSYSARCHYIAVIIHHNLCTVSSQH